jgi:hypothetical protein
MEERAVRACVDDVERRLEHAEKGERGPEQGKPADDAERGSVVLDGVDEVDDLVDRCPWEGLLDLSDEEGGLVRPPGQPQECE